MEEKLHSLIALQQALQSENAVIQRVNRLMERIREADNRCGLKQALKLAVAYSQGAQLSSFTANAANNMNQK